MKLKLALLLVIAGLALAGCGTATKASHPATTTLGGAPSGQSSSVKVDGQPLVIDVFDFIDPAKDVGGYNTDSQGVAAQDADHFATAKLQIINEGNSTIASGSLSVVAYDQNGTAYSSVANDNNVVGNAYQNIQCSSGSALVGNPDLSSLSPSEAFTYCLAFILPEPDTVSRIEVSAIVGNGTGYNSWSITDPFLGWKS
jgi:hypothetical protein